MWHVAVASGFAVGQWLLCEWTRSPLVRREGGIMWVASATGVGHVGWWHWSAGGIGTVPSAQLSLFRADLNRDRWIQSPEHETR